MKKFTFSRFMLFFLLPAALLLTAASTVRETSPVPKISKDFAYIPSGSASIGGKEVKFDAFYLLKTEVTNAQYLEFLNDLKSQGKNTEYETSRIRQEKWDEYKVSGVESYNTLMEYPVVNIQKEGAQLYCKWLENKLNLDKNSDVFYEVRLPSRSEWEYAARGGIKQMPYPWGTHYTRDKSGNFLAHFYALGQVIGPVKTASYPANNFGLFDMAGNVAEMTSDSPLVMGGSWFSTAEDIQVDKKSEMFVSPTIGFRPVVTFRKK